MGIKRKALTPKNDVEEPRLGPRPKKLHKDVDADRLQDAIDLNETATGFKLVAAPGDMLVVTRPLDGGMFTSVCLVCNVGDGPDGLVETYDETRQQFFNFTPNSAAIHYDTVQIKLLGDARVVLA